MSGSYDGTVCLWDAQTGGQVGTLLQEHTSSVNTVAFSPDGRHVASGSIDVIQLWDAQTSGLVGSPLQGHTDTVNSVSFSPNGRHIVSGSYDRTIQVWDVQTGNQVGNPLQGHTHWVLSVAFSPDGGHIVCHDRDNSRLAPSENAHKANTGIRERTRASTVPPNRTPASEQAMQARSLLVPFSLSPLSPCTYYI